jgi:hypothetical protein
MCVCVPYTLRLHAGSCALFSGLIDVCVCRGGSCTNLHAGVAYRVRGGLVVGRRQVVHIVGVAVSRILTTPLLDRERERKKETERKREREQERETERERERLQNSVTKPLDTTAI